MPTVGEGELRFSGFQGPVSFSIDGEPGSLKFGIARLRGWLAAAPADAQEAFRRGEGTLTLEDGKVFRLTFLGHTAEDRKVYFEARV